MKDNFHNGLITELKTAPNVSYVLENRSLFNLTAYKVLSSQEKNGFVKCAKVLYNGKIKLLYFTAGKKNLKNMMSLIDADSFLVIVSNIIKAVIDLKNIGFLDCSNLDLSFDKVFVDPHTLSVSLIYLPVFGKNDDTASFENELRSSLIKLITSTPSIANSKISKVSAYLSNGSLSLNELYKSIVMECQYGSLNNGFFNKQEFKHKSNTPFNTQPVLMFNSLDSNNPVKLTVNTSPFVIGKNPAKVDGVIGFNKAIGRVHCRFVYQNGTYYIIDGDGIKSSTNGTYINGVRLQGQQPYPVKNGDIIRLANSDFSVSI